MLLVVALHKDTNTGVGDQKGTGGGGTHTLFPKPAITCQDTYLHSLELT